MKITIESRELSIIETALLAAVAQYRVLSTIPEIVEKHKDHNLGTINYQFSTDEDVKRIQEIITEANNEMSAAIPEIRTQPTPTVYS